MAERTVIRAERIEVVDGQGRLRVVIGTLNDQADMVGVSVRDTSGSERGYLISDEDGCEAGVAALGNIVAGIRVYEAGETSVFLADATGAVVWQGGAG